MDQVPRERARPQVFPIKALEKGFGSVTGKREFPGKEGFGPFRGGLRTHGAAVGS
ncbi:MAG: hypothetical protein ABGX05_03260 [Pirellulaceae bacterium]